MTRPKLLDNNLYLKNHLSYGHQIWYGDEHRFCIFCLGVKVKGHTGQGQRSHWPGSNEGPKEGQVGSHQRQVASLSILLTLSDLEGQIESPGL